MEFIIILIFIVVSIASSKSKVQKLQQEQAEQERRRLAAQAARRQQEMGTEGEINHSIPKPYSYTPINSVPEMRQHTASGTTSATTDCSHEGEGIYEIPQENMSNPDATLAERLRKFKAARAQVEAEQERAQRRQAQARAQQLAKAEQYLASHKTSNSPSSAQEPQNAIGLDFDKKSLLSGILYAEILGKPKSMRR